MTISPLHQNKSSTKIKVMILIDNLACGGKERRLVSLLHELQNIDQVECQLVLIDGEIFYKEIYDYGINIKVLNRRFKRDLLILYKLFTAARNFQPNIIHSWGSMPSIYAVPVAKLLGIKLMNAEIANAPKSLTIESIVRTKFSFHFSDLIVSNSKQGLISYNAPMKKSVCIYNGFDFGRIDNLRSEDEVKDTFGIKTKYVVGMVSAIYPKKDYLTFLIAAMEITQLRNDVTFMVVGDGEMLPNFKRMTNKYPNIIYTGKQGQVENIVNIFDIGVLCTNSDLHGEGIANSILEYMALKKPVIASKGGGTDEIIEDGVNGFLCNPKKPAEIVEKIIYLIDNPNEAHRLGLAGYQKVRKHFSLEGMVQSTLFHYFSLVGSLPEAELPLKDEHYKYFKPTVTNAKMT